MGASMGLAVALSRTATPALGHGSGMGATPPTPPMSAKTYLTEFSVDLLWLTVAGAGLLWYAWAALTLGRRGGNWPMRRARSVPTPPRPCSRQTLWTQARRSSATACNA